MKRVIAYILLVLVTGTAVGIMLCDAWGGRLTYHPAGFQVAPAKNDVPSSPTNTSLFDRSKNASHPLISPDGEWLLDVRKVGAVPFGRFVNYYVVFVNLKSGHDRYVYLDWFERAADAPQGPSPLGWSPDGKYAYFFYPRDPNSYSIYARMMQHGGKIIAVPADTSIEDAAPLIEPYADGSYPAGTTGYVLDADPVLETAVWIEETAQTNEARLIMFSMRDPVSTAKTIVRVSADEDAKIASVALDVTGQEVAYVLHTDDRDDRVFLYDAKKDASLPVVYDMSLVKKLGLTGRLAVTVQKTAMSFGAGHGLFLTVQDEHGKKIVLRRYVANDKTSWFQE